MKENLVKMTREEIKARQLHVLKEMDRFCKEHKIKYMLAYGTLIGAIRHKGFIPWDDDIDVMLLRPDYDRFVAEYKDNEDFGVANIYTRKDYTFNFARLYDKHTYNIKGFGKWKDYGVNIDVYPLDVVSENDEQFQIHWNQVKTLAKKKNILRIILSRLHKLPGSPFTGVVEEKIYKTMVEREKLVKKYNYEDGNVVTVIASQGYDRHPKELFEETINVTFEGLSFPAPKGYHTFLTNYYGDYMQLPPKDKRVPYHGGNYYWIK